jgi:hypothetical protein
VGVADKTVTVTQDFGTTTAILGNTEIYGLSTLISDRRAQRVTFTESGTIQSISIYHMGGTGNLLLGVYSDQGGSPSSLLGVTLIQVIKYGWRGYSRTRHM